MCHYSAPTPKRHYAYGNSKTIRKIDKGILQGWKKKADHKTVEHYVDKQGKRRWKGTKSLKSTEIPGFNNFNSICMLSSASRFLKPTYYDRIWQIYSKFGISTKRCVIWTKIFEPSGFPGYIRCLSLASTATWSRRWSRAARVSLSCHRCYHQV